MADGSRKGIRAVAEAAGVSVTTVSHALSGQGQISFDTRLRVQEVAARLGYAPNRIARALRSSRSHLLGFVSEEIATTPFAGRILVGAQEAAADAGFMLLIVNVTRDTLHDPQIDALVAQQVEATIFASTSHRIITAPRRLDPTRTVLVDAFDPARASASVVPDEVGIGEMATRRLLEAGHRRIVHVTVDEDVPAVGGRETGYVQALFEAGLHPHVVRVPGPADAAAGEAAMRQALVADPDLTAVFAFNDQMAMGLYQEAPRLGRGPVPEDLSIIGVDNLEIIAGALRPGLTTVALPHAEMGRRAVSLLLEGRLPELGDAPVHALKGHLVERRSITSPPIVTVP